MCVDILCALPGRGVDTRVLTSDQLRRCCPEVRFAEDVTAAHEERARVLLGDRIFVACVGWLRWRSEPVTLLPTAGSSRPLRTSPLCT